MTLRIFILLCLFTAWNTPVDTVASTFIQPADEMDDQNAVFQKAMDFYTEGVFDSAATLFAAVPTSMGHLFAGKSHFALSNYPLAQHHLQQVRRDDDPRIHDEARYTLALADFQTRQFGMSLDRLYDLKSRPAHDNLHRDAETLYHQVMGYLTTGQRKDAFMQSRNSTVRFDLVRYGIDHMLRQEAKELFDTLYPYYEATIDTNVLAALNRRIQRLPDTAPEVPAYGKAPDGMIYNIGVMLPAAEAGSREWSISRALFNGYLLAAEEFNRKHNDKFIRLHHLETSDTALTMEAAMARLAWMHHADAILGPLFSSDAYRIRDLTEFYQITMIPPLANADTLNISNPYLYQINPTFETRGKAMARFAVRELGLDTLAVITQRGLPVEREARAFRNEAERLGATIAHYFSEDFDARAFEVAHITPWFAGHERFIDIEEFPIVPVHGLYLAITGAGADHLIDLILNDLQAVRSRVTILSNEEMSHVDLTENRRRYFDIYYSSFFHRDNDQRETINFQANYRSLTGFNADNFAHLGYDVGRYLFHSIATLENPERLKNKFRFQPAFDGVITRIGFRGTHVNQRLHFMKVERDYDFLLEYYDDEWDEEEDQWPDESEDESPPREEDSSTDP